MMHGRGHLMKTLNEISSFLKAKGIKPSMQRVLIYDYLVKHRNHPSVDMIYTKLSPDLPTLSRTTVYNTLKLFLDHAIAIAITINENECRYDADTSIHGHFKCEDCGEIYDFDVDLNSIIANDVDNFEITEHHVYFKGICNNCRPAKTA